MIKISILFSNLYLTCLEYEFDGGGIVVLHEARRVKKPEETDQEVSEAPELPQSHKTIVLDYWP